MTMTLPDTTITTEEKAVRERTKRLRGCRCEPAPASIRVPCHWGNCTEWRCPFCNGLDMSTGPAWCPCDGYVRWLRYPGMDNRYRRWDGTVDDIVTARVAVKPSVMKRRNRRKQKQD